MGHIPCDGSIVLSLNGVDHGRELCLVVGLVLEQRVLDGVVGTNTRIDLDAREDLILGHPVRQFACCDESFGGHLVHGTGRGAKVEGSRNRFLICTVAIRSGHDFWHLA